MQNPEAPQQTGENVAEATRKTLFKGNLWRHREFMKLWAGDTVTQFTGQVTALALPAIAILTLNVTSFQLGILNDLGFIAFPALGLFAGVLVDRLRRRLIMIFVNIVEFATLAIIPMAYFFGIINLYELYVVALIMGIGTLFYDVAYQSYLPSLVNKEDVVEGNQKLQTSASAAEVAGPSIASGLMAAFGAALSLIADVIGTFVAAVSLALIKKPEPKLKHNSDGKGSRFFDEMKAGVMVVFGNNLLWTQAGATATSNLGTNIFYVAVLLYAYRVLGISKGIIGIAFSIGALGFVAGVLTHSYITNKLGFGTATSLAATLQFGLLIVLLAGRTYSVAIIGAAYFFSTFGNPIYNINMVSLRQIITPNALQGRMNATMRTIVWGTIPLGAFLGGILATSIGLIPTLVVGSVVAGCSVFWLIFGPVGKLRRCPEPIHE